MARNLIDVMEGFLLGKRYFIHDRDPVFTGAFRSMLRDSGVNPLKLPAKSPNLNSFAERFVLSFKSECMNRIIPLSETHLRRAVKSFTEHYHFERSHQGLGNELIEKTDIIGGTKGNVKRRERLGGLLNYYYREAA
jgi:transposase InsO family protein